MTCAQWLRSEQEYTRRRQWQGQHTDTSGNAEWRLTSSRDWWIFYYFIVFSFIKTCTLTFKHRYNVLKMHTELPWEKAGFTRSRDNWFRKSILPGVKLWLCGGRHKGLTNQHPLRLDCAREQLCCLKPTEWQNIKVGPWWTLNLEPQRVNGPTR